MAKKILRKVACLSCTSSDARAIYEDGTSFCFSCQKFFPSNAEDLNYAEPEKPKYESKMKLDDIAELVSRPFKDRGISKEVTSFYGVKVSYNNEGEIESHYYPYDNGTAYKVRKLPKDFTWVGKSTSLFGMDKFQGGGRRVIISEGEIDALSMAQASFEKYGKFYPCLAMSSAAMTKSLLEARTWLRTFDEVILAMDNDEPGLKAQEEAIRIIGIDKVKIVKLTEKDPNAYMLKHGCQKLMQAVFDAQPYIPNGIITKDDLWKSLVEYNNTPSLPYPRFLHGMNAKVKGARLGEIALFVSGTSCGKSTVMREIMLEFKNATPKDTKIGVVSLEESPAETARKLSGMEIYRNPAKEEIPIDELKPGFDAVFGDDRFVVLDHQGSLKDETILDKIEYMALSGCKYIVIDHITILVSEGAGSLSGNEAVDKVMNDLLRFVKRYNVWIGLVSHLRKTPNQGKAFEEGEMPNLDDIKGSGSIKQISFDIIAFARNLQDEDPIKRNTIKMAVLKCRYTGLTGPVDGAYYDYDTGRFKSLDDAPKSNAADDFKKEGDTTKLVSKVIVSGPHADF